MSIYFVVDDEEFNTVEEAIDYVSVEYAGYYLGKDMLFDLCEKLIQEYYD